MKSNSPTTTTVWQLFSSGSLVRFRGCFGATRDHVFRNSRPHVPPCAWLGGRGRRPREHGAPRCMGSSTRSSGGRRGWILGSGVLGRAPGEGLGRSRRTRGAAPETRALASPPRLPAGGHGAAALHCRLRRVLMRIPRGPAAAEGVTRAGGRDGGGHTKRTPCSPRRPRVAPEQRLAPSAPTGCLLGDGWPWRGRDEQDPARALRPLLRRHRTPYWRGPR